MSSPEKPEVSELPPSYKRLRALVIGLGIVLVVGFAVVFGTIIYRAVNLMQGEPTEVATVEDDVVGVGNSHIDRPIGAELVDVEIDDNTMVLRFSGPDGDTLIVVDMMTGQETGRVRVP